MKNKIFKIAIFVVSVVISGTSISQNGINSPYSQFGIGEIKSPFTNPYTNAMGGLSYTIRNNFFINSNNPASYTAIDTNSFVFDMGLCFDFTSLNTTNESLFDADGNLSHLAVGFPITRWWKTSVGLLPWSDVSYKTSKSEKDDSLGTATTTFDGNGSLNKIYWGNAFAITRNLSLGFNANFLFGTITRGINYEFPDSAYVLNSMKIKETSIKNFSIDFGAQYVWNASEKQTWIFGLTCSLPLKLTVDDQATQYTYITNGTSSYVRDTIYCGNYESSLELPLTIGFGIACIQNDLWMVGLDLTYSEWNSAKYIENPNPDIFGKWDALKYNNNYKASLGFEKRSDRKASKYYQRMSYRFGIHYENGKSEILGHRIDDYGIHCGLSFPVRKMKSFINLSFQYGIYGTTNYELVRKNYLQIGLSLSINDTWFKKRKYE